jgi:hypothetical protein
MEANDDISWWNAFFGEGFGDDGFCSIVSDPDFAIFDVDVKDEVEDAFLVFPPDVGELVMVVFGVADNFYFYVVGVTVGMGFISDDLPSYLLVLLKLIHWLILSTVRTIFRGNSRMWISDFYRIIILTLERRFEPSI